MARMYPDTYNEETPASEEKFFNHLKHYASTKGWVVLHSLGLSRPTGEIDFVVLIPNEGFVCIEVKGGHVFSENGNWYGINKSGNTHRKPQSPFLQSRKSMFNLWNDVKEHFGDSHILSKSTWHYMVCFTDIECPPVTPEFIRSDVIDVNDIMNDAAKNIIQSLKDRRVQLNRQSEYFSPSNSNINTLLKFLRPNFDRIPLKSASIAFSEEKIISLTEEQYEGLDLLEMNDRCLIEGSAGTGKTVLAIEFAKRMSKKNLSVLVICYNNLLGSWMSDQFLDFPNVSAGNFHKVFRDLILKSNQQENYLASEAENKNDFFANSFCDYAQDAIIDTETQFDILIVDEVQDLCTTGYFDVLDMALQNGLKHGKWGIFGDFNRQSLYVHIETEPRQLISQYTQNSNFTQQRLKMNCRNTLNIVEATAFLSGFEKVPSKGGVPPGLPVDYQTWKSPEEELKKLSEILIKLKQDKIPYNQIMILSPKKYNNSVASKLDSKYKVKEITKSNFRNIRSEIGFSSIYSFKGMESSVIIITDLDKSESSNYDSLLYTGMSRAKSLLTVLFSEETHQSLQPRILASIMEDLK